MGTKRIAFFDEEAKEQFDPDSDIPVLGEGKAEDWGVLDSDPDSHGFVLAEAPGDGDLDVVGVLKERGTEAWTLDAGDAPRPSHSGYQVPETTANLEVVIRESNIRPPDREYPGFSSLGLDGHTAEHTVRYEVDLDDDVANFVAHETPDRPATPLAERLDRRVRKLADEQVRDSEGYVLDVRATDVDGREVGTTDAEEAQRGI